MDLVDSSFQQCGTLSPRILGIYKGLLWVRENKMNHSLIHWNRTEVNSNKHQCIINRRNTIFPTLRRFSNGPWGSFEQGRHFCACHYAKFFITYNHTDSTKIFFDLTNTFTGECIQSAIVLSRLYKSLTAWPFIFEVVVGLFSESICCKSDGSCEECETILEESWPEFEEMWNWIRISESEDQS